jgi:hypothetical protein
MPHGLRPLNHADPGDLAKLQAGQLLDFIVQEHNAQRAGKHYDVRFGNPEMGLYSWATRKGLPEPGKSHALFQQPVHDHSYGDFQGTLRGYGAGEVRQHLKGQIRLEKASPTKIVFTLGDGEQAKRYALVKPQLFGAKQWLLVNTAKRESNEQPTDRRGAATATGQPGDSTGTTATDLPVRTTLRDGGGSTGLARGPAGPVSSHGGDDLAMTEEGHGQQLLQAAVPDLSQGGGDVPAKPANSAGDAGMPGGEASGQPSPVLRDLPDPSLKDPLTEDEPLKKTPENFKTAGDPFYLRALRAQLWQPRWDANQGVFRNVLSNIGDTFRRGQEFVDQAHAVQDLQTHTSADRTRRVLQSLHGIDTAVPDPVDQTLFNRRPWWV